MKPVFVYWIMFLLVLAIGCSEDVATPKDTPPSNGDETTATIGSDGGTLESGGFILDVPRGAFADSVTLSLFRDDQAEPFGAQTASPEYRLEGLPSVFSLPLSIGVKIPDGTTGVPTVGQGQTSFVRSLGTLQLGWSPLDADTTQSGWWSVQLAPPEASAGQRMTATAQAAAAPVHFAAAAGNETLRTEAGHFKIWYPQTEVTPVEAEALGEYLEEAFQIYYTMGFHYTTRTAWPVRITVRDMDAFGFFASTAAGNNSGYMEFDTDYMSDAEEIHLTAGHETFHMAQFHCDPRDPALKAVDLGAQYWLDEATAVWSEEFYTDVQDFISAARTNVELTPLEGMLPPAGAHEGHHGYGMSSMIKYLADLYGDNFIGDVYNDILGGDAPMKALGDNLPAPFEQWWGIYLRELIANNIYPDIPDLLDTYNPLYSMVFSTLADSLKKRTWHMDDLSGAIFRVELTDNFEDFEGMDFVTRGGDCDVSVFGYRPAYPLEPLGNAPDSVTVSNLEYLAARYESVFVLVSNKEYSAPDYDGDAVVTLTARRNMQRDFSGFGKAVLMIIYRAEWADGTTTSNEVFHVNDSGGSFTNNVYTATWDSTEANFRRHGSFTFTVDQRGSRILNWAVEKRIDSDVYNLYQLWRCTGGSIPLHSDWNNELRYVITGTRACDPIVELTHTITYNGEVTKELTGYSCLESASLEIRVSPR